MVAGCSKLADRFVKCDRASRIRMSCKYEDRVRYGDYGDLHQAQHEVGGRD